MSSPAAAEFQAAPPGHSPQGVRRALSAVDHAGDRARLKAELQSRINGMQNSRPSSRRLPTVPVLAGILPGGGLQAGAAYSVVDSTTLAMALLAGPSGAGAWCSVIGMPAFSVEAAAGFGIALDKLVLVPNPGDKWLTVTAAMVDVVSIVLTCAPQHIAPADASRLMARLRQRGAALVTMGSWPHSEATLSVTGSNWQGLGSGTGHLRSRRMRITAKASTGRSRTADLWLPDLQRGPWSTSMSPAVPAARAEPGQQEFFSRSAS